MVVIDASVLLLLLRPGTAVPADVNGLPVDKPKERIEFLISQLQKAREKIVIPSPALSEALVRAGAQETQRIVDYLNKYAVFRIEPFDTRAAIEVAAMVRGALASKGTKGKSVITWAKVKFDRQIVATAKVVGASKIYSDDGDIRTLAKQHNIVAMGIADLPLPEEERQFKLQLEGHSDGQGQAVSPGADQQDETSPPSAG